MPALVTKGRPVIQYQSNWKLLAAIACVNRWSFHFRLFPGTIRSFQVIIFLNYLMTNIKGDLLVLWDGSPKHRSTLIKEFAAAQMKDCS